MAPQVYLISGTSRGFGLALVRVLLKRKNVFVFAGARKPSSELEALVEAHPDKVRVVKLTSGDETDNKAAVAEIQSVAGRLDVVIANAGIGLATGSVLETSPQAMTDHFSVNTIGPLVLFQATYPLLKAITTTPKFIPISSLVGSIKLREVSPGLTLLAYGTSKAALNYLTMKLRADHDDLICFPIEPGVVDTDMLNHGIAHGVQLPRGKPADETAEYVLARIDEGSRRTNVFVQWDGVVRPW